MQDFEKLGAFYLGRTKTDEPLLYDSKDLVTHAVVVGMTGSGKTGLCVGLLEEAAIDGVPALVIDPKGDIGNLLLQFPELRGEDFAPWVNEEDAQRENLTREQLAEAQAAQWKEGLQKWGQSGERIRKLSQSADFAIYTPGSNAGLPMSLLKSFAAPDEAAREDRELFRDRINGTATAVLSLMGIHAEPMKSREHILLANIFDCAWREGKDLIIEDLIHKIQDPPMERVGVMEIESFYPAKERFELAMSLNSLLASPGFEAWLEGEPLDISRLLYTTDGKPRIAILSIAHLSESERMFFVTLVLNEMLSWTRQQSGTTSLRAILYMDEIFGYFPPVSNPPSKRPLLTLLKQARAFGVGVVLATQNPVDLDYKGLANAGTWFIGRLQTERDKQRLIEGLEGAANDGSGAFDRAATQRMLAGLGKRMFLMNNVHESGPVAFESRWALSYLRGPLTRNQIRQLTKGREAAPPAASPSARAGERTAPASASTQRVVLPPDVPQAFIPVRGSHSRIVYKPVLLGAAKIRFVETKSGLDVMQDKVFMTPIHDDALPVQWEECEEAEIDPNDLEREPAADAEFEALPAPATKAKSYIHWGKDLGTWIFGHQQLAIYSSPALKLYSKPEESEGDFRIRVQHATHELRDAQIEKLRAKYATKIATLQDRMRRSEQTLAKEREQSQGQTLDTVVSVGAGLFGALFGRKKLTTAAGGVMRSAGRARKEAADISRAEENVQALQEQLRELEARVESEIEAIRQQTGASIDSLESICIKPKKANIQVRLLTLAWAPYTRDEAGQLMTPAWE
jgi:Sec-independent protein translocase protein TatA